MVDPAIKAMRAREVAALKAALETAQRALVNLMAQSADVASPSSDRHRAARLQLEDDVAVAKARRAAALSAASRSSSPAVPSSPSPTLGLTSPSARPRAAADAAASLSVAVAQLAVKAIKRKERGPVWAQRVRDRVSGVRDACSAAGAVRSPGGGGAGSGGVGTPSRHRVSVANATAPPDAVARLELDTRAATEALRQSEAAWAAVRELADKHDSAVLAAATAHTVAQAVTQAIDKAGAWPTVCCVCVGGRVSGMEGSV